MLLSFLNAFNGVQPENSLMRGNQQFIFAAEIPVYTPSPLLSDEQLLSAEHTYFTRKRKKIAQPEAGIEYVIEDPKQHEKEPWRGRFTPYKKSKEGPAEKLEPVEKMVELFSNEAFGTNTEESISQFDKQMRLVLLANRMKSIFAVHNQSLKHQYGSPFNNVLVMRGAWEPKWVKRKNARGKGVPVSLQEVRNYMRYCLEKSKENSPQASQWKKRLNDLIQQEQSISGHVPYHELREYLRVAEERRTFVQSFVNSHPEATLYEATHDSDLVGLRTRDSQPNEIPTGLYTHYMKILSQYHRDNNRPPDVVTTGYRAAYDGRFVNTDIFPWLYQVIEEDRYLKAATSTVDYRVTYIAEPNCLYLVRKNENCIEESFLQLPNGEILTPANELGSKEWNTYAPCESMAIMVQRHKNKGSQSPAVLFNPTHPVLMKLPERMLYDKHTKGKIQGGVFGRYDYEHDVFEVSDSDREELLKLPSKISQSPLSFRDYGITLYRQLGLIIGKEDKKYFYEGEEISYPNSAFQSLSYILFNYFDLKESTVAGPPKNLSIENLGEKWGNDCLVERLKEIKGFVDVQQQIEELITAINSIYGKDIGDILFKTARIMGQARRDHHAAFFDTKGINASRVSPKIFIPQDQIGNQNTQTIKSLPNNATKLYDIAKDTEESAERRKAAVQALEEKANTKQSKGACDFLRKCYKWGYGIEKDLTISKKWAQEHASR